VGRSSGAHASISHASFVIDVCASACLCFVRARSTDEATLGPWLTVTGGTWVVRAAAPMHARHPIEGEMWHGACDWVGGKAAPARACSSACKQCPAVFAPATGFPQKSSVRRSCRSCCYGTWPFGFRRCATILKPSATVTSAPTGALIDECGRMRASRRPPQAPVKVLAGVGLQNPNGAGADGLEWRAVCAHGLYRSIPRTTLAGG
jgi:hypothetical protein